MNNRQILYSADLQKTGKSLKLGAFVLIVAGLIISVICLMVGNFSGRLILLVFIWIFIAGTYFSFFKISKWSKTSGIYQIYLDSIGFHVHSDDQGLGETFSIATLNLSQLVRKRVGDCDTIEYEYYIEEKSGERHKISTTLADYNLDVMDMFEKIACQYPSVKIVDELA